MTNPGLILETAGVHLQAVPTDRKDVHLNPLFQPEVLEHLTQTMIQELERYELGTLGTEVVKGSSTVQDYGVPAPTPPSLDLSVPPATSPFYFIEELETKIPDVPSPVPSIAAKPEQLVYGAAIDPLFVPYTGSQTLQRPSFFDVHTLRQDFPILQERVNGKPLIWFDNAATTQKPQVVIDRLVHFYSHENSNVHRAAHELAARSTDAYEAARDTVRRFLNASSANEIIFVRGTTEGINLVAKSWGQQTLQPGDEIVLTHLEHHANIVP